MSGRLTAAFVKSVRHRGGRARADRHHDGGHGLFLQVMPSGSKQWCQRLSLDGKRSDYGLGAYPFMGLAEARRKAFENALAAREYRRAVACGGHRDLPAFEASRLATVARRNGQPVPLVAAPVAGIPFAAAYEACIVERAKHWRDPATALRSWRASLRDHMAGFAQLPVARVDVDHLRRALEPLAPKTADKALRRIGTVMEWAIAGKHRADNPARSLRRTLAGLSRGEAQHRKAMHHAKVGALLARVRTCDARADVRRAFELMVLTGLRPGEAMGARWEELDLDARTWTLPGARMKDGRQHRVPLSAQAVALLQACGPAGEGRVFCAPRGGPLGEKAFRELLARLGVTDATPHGFRSSLRDWCAETGVAREVAEAILAHRNGNSVEQAYARSDLFERRRAVMDAWAAYVAG